MLWLVLSLTCWTPGGGQFIPVLNPHRYHGRFNQNHETVCGFLYSQDPFTHRAIGQTHLRSSASLWSDTRDGLHVQEMASLLVQVITAGCIGLINPSPTVVARTPIFGQTYRTTHHPSSSLHRVLNLRTANRRFCFLLGIQRPSRGINLPYFSAFRVAPIHARFRHFHWMAQHSVDGAFLQRFLGQTDEGEGILRIRDEVGDRVREAAEKEERVFAIMCVLLSFFELSAEFCSFMRSQRLSSRNSAYLSTFHQVRHLRRLA